jgi:hypothetical protein
MEVVEFLEYFALTNGKFSGDDRDLQIKILI